jgi:heat shock protein HtpX
MPLTFIDIERRKTWRIWIFFLVLMLLYFCIAVLSGMFFLPVSLLTAPRFWFFGIVMAAVIAGTHFWFSAYGIVNTIIIRLEAKPPDRQDDIHRVLINIIEEMHVATGNRRSIRCVVIPSLSMNAMAASDLNGDAVIGITEGLLSRLSRPQLETVIAHEAHHILSGDCLEATVAASLFGVYAETFEKLSNVSNGRTFFSPALILAWFLLQLSYLLNLFISREREYRADAAAVRMSRNPIALAETLHLLARSRRGAGFIGGGFQALCIVNPNAMALDESEGFFADLLSTHPPIRRRIEVLLKMARVSIAELDARAERAARRGTEIEGPVYYALSPKQEWQGPFTMSELAALPWLSPLTWLTAGHDRPVDRAWKEPAINSIFMARLAGKENLVSDHACPQCKQPLVARSFEGVRIFKCNFCAGTLVENEKIGRIIARTGMSAPCSERINALARTEVTRNHARHMNRLIRGRAPIPLFACPKCKNSMQRGFYSSAHFIEVDRCSFCGLTWFEQDELAMLQSLIENRIVPDLGAAPETSIPQR